MSTFKKRRWNLLFLLITATILSPACKKKDTAELPEKKEYNLKYGNHNRNKLDVFLPANRDEKTPFILLIHGGAWVAGDKSYMNGIQKDLLQKDIASASMNYRYAGGGVTYRELMEDVKQALSYCQNKADSWKIRSDKYILGGASAGAHMALLYAYNYDDKNLIRGIISAAGPTDLTDTAWLDYATVIAQLPNVEKMTGAKYVKGKPLDPAFAAASPIAHIKNVPALFFHGDKDAVVFYDHSVRLSTALDKAGIENKLETIKGGGHDLGLGNAITYDMFIEEISEWVEKYGK